EESEWFRCECRLPFGSKRRRLLGARSCYWFVMSHTMQQHESSVPSKCIEPLHGVTLFDCCATQFSHVEVVRRFPTSAPLEKYSWHLRARDALHSLELRVCWRPWSQRSVARAAAACQELALCRGEVRR